MEKQKKYIHYGHSRFKKEVFIKPINQPFCVKPWGGFWASPADAKWGWKQWCESENFYTNRLTRSFEFTLSPEAKVLHIRSVEDLNGLPGQQCDFMNWVCLDFEKLMEEGYDAVELHLSEEKRSGSFQDGLYYVLYGWDCDSILVMNPDIIVV